MKNIRLFIVFVALSWLFVSPAVHAEAIGRVLVAVGDTTALRGGVAVKLARGEEIQSGDTLRVGDASNMQVRFTDESITALRSNSVLRIDDYKFESVKNVGKSFFSLVKGGMRSITGLIGRFNRDNYAVRATSATIGIRGTHFVLAQCNNDCFNKDGSKAEDGLFGGVTDGRIAVNNQAGEKEFGKNEFFHVPSFEALPKPLLTPPSFLRDQLEGQTKSKESKPVVAKAADDGTAKNGDKADSGEEQQGSETVSATTTEQQTDTAVTTQPTDTAQPSVQVAVDTQFVPTEQVVVQTNVSSGLINTVLAGQTFPYQMTMVNAWAGVNNFTSATPVPFNGTSLFGFSEGWIDQGKLTVLDPTKLLQAQDVLFADFVINKTPVTTFLMNAYSASGISDYYYFNGNCGWNCVGILDGTESFTWAKTASTDIGADAGAGNLTWGRYTHTSTSHVLTGTFAGNTNSETSYEHWATGDLLNIAALPTTGSFSYAYAGGTRPTDQNGNTGTILSGGTVGITFTGANGASVSLTGASWNMPTTGNTYSMSFSNQAVAILQSPYNTANSGWAESGTTTSLTPIINVGATCSGACSNNLTPVPVNSTVSPMLFGANAQGLAVGVYTTMLATGASPAENTASVQVYKAAVPPI
ncbi:MAG: FecR domain-containing protein [Gallionella sp.]|nr:FecR domain-containing protein [Gallionella sp.]